MQTIKISKTRPDPQQTTISTGKARNENMEVNFKKKHHFVWKDVMSMKRYKKKSAHRKQSNSR